ncbi:ZIP family metal transporter [Vallitalea longa]|uniref:ZIP family metal transporter n=1 Tax=Vallitalea longa TaxID=2936439 RepID=A0A9W5YEN1_9FIRM|nr:ZIP family metal transporter [Vallitalea longa]GKX31115.1 ZIP family metal transporter [Vallitalea longa]
MGNSLSFLISFMTGLVGLSLGVIIIYRASNRGRRFEGVMLAFTAGLMLSIVCFELLPKAFETGGLYLGLIGIFIGIIFVLLLEDFLNKNKKLKKDTDNRYIKSAILLSIAFMIHNIPEGIAIGSIMGISSSEGLRFAFAILVHNIPEGMIIALPLIKSKVKLLYILLIVSVVSLSMGIGAVIGLTLSHVSQKSISLSLGIAGGIMLYVTTGEIIVKSMVKWKGRSITISIILGILLGVLLSYD